VNHHLSDTSIQSDFFNPTARGKTSGTKKGHAFDPFTDLEKTYNKILRNVM
jgi:hypothetical protein